MTTERPAEKRINPGKALLAIAGGIVALFFVFHGVGGLLKLGGARGPTAPSGDTVIYRVTGSTDKASITFRNDGGGTEMRGDARVPWETILKPRRGAFLYVSAQNGNDSGAIKCEIVLNGRVVKDSYSTGPYVIATCSGSL